MASTHMKVFVALILAGALGAGVALKAGWLAKAKDDRVTAPVAVADIEDTVLASGTLKPIKMVAVGAQLSGRVVSLNVVVGQKVEQGDLIAQLDPVTKQNDLRTSEAALDNMRAQRVEKEATLDLAKRSLARQKSTYAQKASSRGDYESAQATVKQTQAQIDALDAQITEAEVSIENAKVNLNYSRIATPIAGTVLSVVTPEGQTVNAVQSAPTIVVVGQLDTMTIRAEISEVDVVKVAPGQEAYFTILGDPERRYSATLDSIEPAPESVKNDSSFGASATSSTSTSTSAIYYNAIFRVPNPEGRLRTYMTAEVHMIVAKSAKALTIPSSALKRRNADGTREVEVPAGDGAVAVRAVRVGIDNRLTAEVLDDLKEGDRVVVRHAGTATSTGVALPGGPPGI